MDQMLSGFTNVWKNLYLLIISNYYFIGTIIGAITIIIFFVFIIIITIALIWHFIAKRSDRSLRNDNPY